MGEKYDLAKILIDLQEGARGVKHFQGELEVLEERSASLFGDNPNLELQFTQVREQLSTLWRDHLGSYDPDSGPTIGVSDVLDDMEPGSSVVGGGAQAPSSPAPANHSAQGQGIGSVQTAGASFSEDSAARKLARIEAIVNE